MYFKQRLLWIGFVITLGVIMLVGLALFGDISTAKPKEIPVALVNLDQGASVGNQTMKFGDRVEEKLSGLPLPIQWVVVKNQKDVRKGLDKQDYYGALILPSNFSKDIASLVTPSPKSANVELMINEGMNVEVSNEVNSMLQLIMNEVSKGISSQILNQMSIKAQAVPIKANVLLSPITVNQQVVHAVGPHSAGGNAPVMITLIAWLGALISSVFLYMVLMSTIAKGGNKWGAVCSQILSGLVLTALYSLLIVWMCNGWYGLILPREMHTWLFLWLCLAAFFVLQSALLNLAGIRSVALFILLLFFSIPVLNLPPEFLPHATKDWIYSWVPLRFVSAGLRELFFFESLNARSLNIIWAVFIGFLILLILSVFKRLEGRNNLHE